MGLPPAGQAPADQKFDLWCCFRPQKGHTSAPAVSFKQIRQGAVTFTAGAPGYISLEERRPATVVFIQSQERERDTRERKCILILILNTGISNIIIYTGNII